MVLCLRGPLHPLLKVDTLPAGGGPDLDDDEEISAEQSGEMDALVRKEFSDPVRDAIPDIDRLSLRFRAQMASQPEFRMDFLSVTSMLLPGPEHRDQHRWQHTSNRRVTRRLRYDLSRRSRPRHPRLGLRGTRTLLPWSRA